MLQMLSQKKRQDMGHISERKMGNKLCIVYSRLLDFQENFNTNTYYKVAFRKNLEFLKIVVPFETLNKVENYSRVNLKI